MFSIIFKIFKDALNDGSVVVAMLSNLSNDEAHTVLIYSFFQSQRPLRQKIRNPNRSSRLHPGL